MLSLALSACEVPAKTNWMCWARTRAAPGDAKAAFSYLLQLACVSYMCASSWLWLLPKHVLWDVAQLLHSFALMCRASQFEYYSLVKNFFVLDLKTEFTFFCLAGQLCADFVTAASVRLTFQFCVSCYSFFFLFLFFTSDLFEFSGLLPVSCFMGSVSSVKVR